jgi:hypothetical protein
MEVAHVEDGYVEYLKELFTHPALCTTCLDEGKEVAAHPKPYRTYMYCVDHHPGIYTIAIMLIVQIFVPVLFRIVILADCSKFLSNIPSWV